jgi:hypothetical protein
MMGGLQRQRVTSLVVGGTALEGPVVPTAGAGATRRERDRPTRRRL